MSIKAVTLGVVLAGTALGSPALTLGRARGAAWIGQTLELTVPVQIDPGQAGGALCAEADVFHGDSRQESNRVQTRVASTDVPDTFSLTISSSALIDEPVVTVYLRAGCSQKFSRKYVLLADFPSEAATPLNNSAPAMPAPLPLVVPGDRPQSATASATSVMEMPPAPVKVLKPAPASKKERAKTVVAAVQAEPKSAPDAQAKTKIAAEPARTADAGKPRLRLDPIETLSERISSLESSTKEAAPAAAVASESQRMQLLQSDMKALLEQALKNEASLAAMRERLEKAESDRVPVEAVYGLGALVLLCLGALAFMWNRRAKDAVWNQPVAPATGLTTAPKQPVNTGQASASGESFEVNTQELDKASFDAMVAKQSDSPKPQTPSKVHEKFSTVKHSHSDFNADHLVDLRQQAEFLAKLGKVDEAIVVLQSGLRSNPKESPLLYLDLLDIASNFNREADFQQYRDQFVQLFNAVVPDLAAGADEGRSLDAYPALLEHINSQWESPHVLDVIEACIVRDPEASESDPFDLAAFRELVNMHGVASEHHRNMRT